MRSGIRSATDYAGGESPGKCARTGSLYGEVVAGQAEGSSTRRGYPGEGIFLGGKSAPATTIQCLIYWTWLTTPTGGVCERQSNEGALPGGAKGRTDSFQDRAGRPLDFLHPGYGSRRWEEWRYYPNRTTV